MGHSLGAMLSFIFSITFPQEVNFLICFDFLKPLFDPYIVEKRGKMIDDFLRYNKYLSDEPLIYTMDELKQMYHLGSWKSVDIDHCWYILERNTKSINSDSTKFYLTRDPRVKVGPLQNFPHEEMLEGAKRLTMPIFVSKGTENPIEDYDKQYFYEVLEVVKQTSVDCRFHLVKGTHHHHLNTPETISDFLTDFLKSYHVNEEIVSLRSNL